jgi:hypothetical protein
MMERPPRGPFSFPYVRALSFGRSVVLKAFRRFAAIPTRFSSTDRESLIRADSASPPLGLFLDPAGDGWPRPALGIHGEVGMEREKADLLADGALVGTSSGRARVKPVYVSRGTGFGWRGPSGSSFPAAGAIAAGAVRQPTGR